jgi:hypothetical protein
LARCRSCHRLVLPGARKGARWGWPGLHARCALALKDHPLERGFNWHTPSGWDDFGPEEYVKNTPVTWWSWGDLYMHWWQYSPPWSVTNWWKFRTGRFCDGVRLSTLIQAPLLGHVVWFHNKPCGHHPTEPDGPHES